MTMPKFNFSQATFKSDAALNEATQRTPGTTSNSSVMLPGRHEVVITGVELKGPAAKDPSWLKAVVKMEGTGGKRISTMLLIPTADIVYGEKKTVFPYRNLQSFMKSIGKPVALETLGEVLGATFGTEGALNGLNLTVEVGYRGNYLRSVKNDIGEKSVRILNSKTNEALKGADGKELSFADFDSAGAYAIQNNIEVQDFPEVLKFDVSATPAKQANGNW